jgi:tetratricopeptide (TPR) repeat protein
MRRFALALLVAAAALAAGVAIQRGRTDTEYRRLIEAGHAALAEGRTYAAIEAFSGALAFRPDSMVAYLRRGEAYQRQDSLDAATRDLTMAVQLDPNATQPLERLGEVSMARGDFARAADWYAQAADRDVTSASLAYRAGYNRYRAGQIAGAIPPLRHAVSRAPDEGEMHYALGLALRDTGDAQSARTALERAVVLAPAHLAARDALAALIAASGDAAEHLRHLEALAGLDPSVPRHIAVALAAASTGRTDRAVLALGSANDLSAGDPRLRLALGRVWLMDAEQKKDRASLRKAAEALEHDTGLPQSSEALALLGRLAYLNGARADALALLERAVELRPVFPEAFRFQSDALRAAGRTSEADAAMLRHAALVGTKD